MIEQAIDSDFLIIVDLEMPIHLEYIREPLIVLKVERKIRSRLLALGTDLMM